MKYTTTFTEFSKVDFLKLDGSQKKQVLKSLLKIEDLGMNAGQPLRGELWDCRKLKHKKLGLRVIFRLSGQSIEIIEIVIVGKREDNEVYNMAAKRLGR
jgi:mRNA interferase RelE/StbE